MTPNWDRVVAIIQLILGLSAVIITPGALIALFYRLRGKIRARCQPRLRGPQAAQTVYNPIEIYRRVWRGIATPLPDNTARTWLISLENRSRVFRDVDISIFPQEADNQIRHTAIYTKNDGGLLVEKDVESYGCLRIVARRFYRKRIISLAIVFSKPGTPAFESSVGDVRRSVFVDWRELGGFSTVSIEITYHRMMLFLIQFFAFTLIIVIRMLYLSINRPTGF